jgi:hypothetical protein
MPFLSKKDLLKEHLRLIPLLRSGTLAQRLKEARSQSIEMKAYRPKK